MANSADDYDRMIGPIEGQMMRAVWRIVRDADEASDVFQEAVSRIWQRWEQIHKHPNPKALILRVCITCACDALRRRIRRCRQQEGLAQYEDRLASRNLSPAAGLMRQELATQISQALAGLPQNQAVTVFMRVVDNLSYEHIAAALGCDQATARTHYRRGRIRLAVELRHLLEEEEVTP